MHSIFSPIDGRGSAELIVRRIVDAVAAGELTPDQKMPTEATLAEQFAVAPMTLRKALDVLRDLGVVVVRRGRKGGTFVSEDAPLRIQEHAPAAEISRRYLRDLTDFRTAVSGHAAYLAAANADGSALHEISRLSDEYNSGKYKRLGMRAIDVQLHSQIAVNSGSSRLYEAEMRIQEDLSQVLASLPDIPLLDESSGSDHQALVSALRRRDGHEARTAMVAHVEETYEWCVALLAAGSTPRHA